MFTAPQLWVPVGRAPHPSQLGRALPPCGGCCKARILWSESPHFPPLLHAGTDSSERPSCRDTRGPLGSGDTCSPCCRGARSLPTGAPMGSRASGCPGSAGRGRHRGCFGQYATCCLSKQVCTRETPAQRGHLGHVEPQQTPSPRQARHQPRSRPCLFLHMELPELPGVTQERGCGAHLTDLREKLAPKRWGELSEASGKPAPASLNHTECPRCPPPEAA